MLKAAFHPRGPVATLVAALALGVSSPAVAAEVRLTIDPRMPTLPCANAEALATTRPAPGQAVNLLGRETSGDGGGQVLVYRATGRSGVTIDEGFYFAGAGSDDYFEAVDKTVADPRRFGAVGDGATDDTARVQAAFNSGAPVRFTDDATYLVSGLSAPAASKVDLGEATLKIKALASGTYTPCITVAGDNVLIRGGWIDGNRGNQPADGFSDSFATAGKGRSARAGIVGIARSGIRVEGVRFRNTWGACIALRNCADVTIHRCDARDCNFELLYTSQSDTNWYAGYRVTNCVTRNIASGDASINANVILFDQIEDFLITNCDFSGNERNHVKLEPARDGRIDSCHFDNVTADGFSSIQIQGDAGSDPARDIALSNLTITRCQTGIVGPQSSTTLASNIAISSVSITQMAAGTTGDGIRCTSPIDGLRIVNVSIKDFDRYGIRVSSNAAHSAKNICIKNVDGSSSRGETLLLLEAVTNPIEGVEVSGLIAHDLQTSAVGDGVVRATISGGATIKDLNFHDNVLYCSATTHRMFWSPTASLWAGVCRYHHNYSGGVVFAVPSSNGADRFVYELNNTTLGTVIAPQVHAGAPTRTPIVVGEEFFNTTAGLIYRAKGTSSAADWRGTAAPITAYAAGTAYSLTNTAAALDFGTTDPAIVITTPGTWRITGRVKLTYNGATVSTETATIKLRRTNNTAADLTNGSTTIDLPVATTLTHDYGWVDVDVIYTTTATDDAITLFGNVSAALGAGTIDATNARIEAQRVY